MHPYLKTDEAHSRILFFILVIVREDFLQEDFAPFLYKEKFDKVPDGVSCETTMLR